MTSMTTRRGRAPLPPEELAKRAWPALWAIVIGFFMILVDSTIVTVALDTIMRKLNTDVNTTLWVTSAYLLAYAVPLLISGRLGDRFGQKNMYLIGLAIFTIASFGCGFSGDITALIIWRVVQGLGAAAMTPQTMSIITRTFPPQKRGAAMGLWGGVAGAATLVGPIVGGLLTDAWGWEWIFFVNVPVGITGFIIAAVVVPRMPTHSHRFDWLGVALSAIGMFFIVFGIQESGQTESEAVLSHAWSFGFIAIGVAVFVLFVIWQHFNRAEPLVPLKLFRDANFSLANLAITFVGAWVTTFALPILLFLQSVHGMTPTESALMLIPQAVLSGILSPFIGRLINRVNPKWIAIAGVGLCAIALFWYAQLLNTDTDLWMLLLPASVLGIGSAGMWPSLSLSATRNLSGALAGAGSGVYNTTRQVGAVVGSASLAALLTDRMNANMPQAGTHHASTTSSSGQALPSMLQGHFSDAVSQTMWLPIIAAVAALVVVCFLREPRIRTGAVGTIPAKGEPFDRESAEAASGRKAADDSASRAASQPGAGSDAGSAGRSSDGSAGCSSADSVDAQEDFAGGNASR